MAPTTRAYARKMRALNITLVKDEASDSSAEYRVKDRAGAQERAIDILDKDVEISARETLFHALQLAPADSEKDRRRVASIGTQTRSVVVTDAVNDQIVPVIASELRPFRKRSASRNRAIEDRADGCKVARLAGTRSASPSGHSASTRARENGRGTLGDPSDSSTADELGPTSRRGEKGNGEIKCPADKNGAAEQNARPEDYGADQGPSSKILKWALRCSSHGNEESGDFTVGGQNVTVRYQPVPQQDTCSSSTVPNCFKSAELNTLVPARNDTVAIWRAPSEVTDNRLSVIKRVDCCSIVENYLSLGAVAKGFSETVGGPSSERTCARNNKLDDIKTVAVWRPHEGIVHRLDNLGGRHTSSEIANVVATVRPSAKRPYVRRNLLAESKPPRRPYVRRNRRNSGAVSAHNPSASTADILAYWNSLAVHAQSACRVPNCSICRLLREQVMSNRENNRVPMLPIEHSHMVTTPELLTPPLTPKLNYKKQLLQLHRQQQQQQQQQQQAAVADAEQGTSDGGSPACTHLVQRKRCIFDREQASILTRKPQVPPEVFREETPQGNETVRQRLRRNGNEKITLGPKSPHVRDELLHSKRMRGDVPASAVTPPAETIVTEPLLDSYLNTFEPISDDESAPASNPPRLMRAPAATTIADLESKQIHISYPERVEALQWTPSAWMENDPECAIFILQSTDLLYKIYQQMEVLLLQNKLPYLMPHDLNSKSLAQRINSMCVMQRCGYNLPHAEQMFLDRGEELLMHLGLYLAAQSHQTKDAVLASLVLFAIQHRIVMPRVLDEYPDVLMKGLEELKALRTDLILRHSHHHRHTAAEMHAQFFRIVELGAESAVVSPQVSVIKSTEQARREESGAKRAIPTIVVSDSEDEDGRSVQERSSVRLASGEKMQSASAGADGFSNLYNFQKHVQDPKGVVNKRFSEHLNSDVATSQTGKRKSVSPINLHKPSSPSGHREPTRREWNKTRFGQSAPKEMTVPSKPCAGAAQIVPQHPPECGSSGHAFTSKVPPSRHVSQLNEASTIPADGQTTTRIPQVSNGNLRAPNSLGKPGRPTSSVPLIDNRSEQRNGTTTASPHVGPDINRVHNPRDFHRHMNVHTPVNQQVLREKLLQKHPSQGIRAADPPTVNFQRQPVEMRPLSDTVRPGARRTSDPHFYNEKSPAAVPSPQNGFGGGTIRPSPASGEMAKSPTVPPRQAFTFERQLSQLSNGSSSSGSVNGDKPATLLPQAYVIEMKYVAELDIADDFKNFYEYVTKSQISHDNEPISFSTFLELLNAGNLKTYQQKYEEYLKMKERNIRCK